MDAPLARFMAEAFCIGYEKQAKKEEKEAEEIVDTINLDALKALCTRYDNKAGNYPEHEYEGAAVFKFFEKLKANVENGKGKAKRRKKEQIKKEKKLPFDDIPVHIRERVYSDIGHASMCWENPGGCGVFDSQKAAEIGLNLCQFILDEIDKHYKRGVIR